MNISLRFLFCSICRRSDSQSTLSMSDSVTWWLTPVYSSSWYSRSEPNTL